MDEDNDALAISRFNQSLELDPYDLDTLLLATAACINEKQGMIALMHLQTWLQNNVEYAHLIDAPITDIQELIAVYE